MAALIPLLMQLAPSVIGALPDIVKNVGHVFGKTIEGVKDVINPEHEVAGINTGETLGNVSKALTSVRTVNGPRFQPEQPEQAIEQRAFYKTKKGINVRDYERYKEPLEYRGPSREYDVEEYKPRRKVRSTRRRLL